ncbi:MBL fold metallo-hydrolase [Pseudoxanthomonas sp. CAU 1598]|uniref:MBL fold metallo-hydrolase n=1 Tax=Pseudomarimonas arenosa TaxID=2774145 RepID=A0AAW3ZRL3_9GAMM|nr:MBL fold metallo-hydrolase [Pseudomarimonas arenosa]
MRVRFHGAAGEVTGSLHRLEYEDRQVLLDCGLIQGGGNEDARNAAGFGFDPRQLDAVVVSHAHIDHCGRLPLLVKRGYSGPIYMTAATADLLRIMLEDSARLAAADAERETRARQRRGEGKVEPLYLLRDVIDTLKQVKPLEYGERREILPGLTLRFEDAGHIIGAAIVELVYQQRGKRKTLVFSGDIGPNAAPILRDPTAMHEADLVLMESTYGDRCHRNRADTVKELGAVLRQAREDGGNVLIPAFAVGRTQEILYWMARYFREWELEQWQINLDSPMALKVTELYQRHINLFDREAKELFAKGLNPFAMPNLRLISDVQDSMALNKRASGQIIIAGSGMCTGGRIKHHLRHNLWRENCDVVFVGYQAARTLGRQLVDGAEFVTIYGEKIRVRARRHTVGGLSAHADQNQLAAWYGHFHQRPPVCLIHGEDAARRALKEKLEAEFRAEVRLPKPGQVAKF